MSVPITKFGEIKREIEDLEDEIVSLPFIVDNFIGRDGGEVTGSIDMTGQAIKNLPNPIDEGDAVPKSYVDSLPAAGNTPFNVVGGEFEAKKKLNLKGFNIENVARPINDDDAANKIYVDTLTKDKVTENEVAANMFAFLVKSNEFITGVYDAFERIFKDKLPLNELLKKKDIKEKYVNSILNRLPTVDNLGQESKQIINNAKESIKRIALDFLDMLLNKFNSLDDATKNNNDEVIKILEREFFKYKLEKNVLDPSFIKLNGHFLAVGKVDMDQHEIKNLPNPIDDSDAVPKSYVDNLPAADNTPFNVVGGEFEAKQKLNIKGFNIENVARPINDDDAANKIYVDTLTENRRRQLEANNAFNLESGDFVAKNKINMKGNKIENVGFPDLPEDVATVAYVDEANFWEKKNGGILAKDHVYLGRKKLGGLKDPIAAGEAATKSYVDKLNEELKDYVEEKTEEIKASVVVDGNNPGNVDAAALDALKTQLEKNQPFNTRNGKTFNARGNLNMRQKTIKNLPEPTDENEVSTKGYTDEKNEELKDYIDESIKKIDVGLIRKNGGFLAADAIDMNSNRIKNVGAPQVYDDAVNKAYVDSKNLNAFEREGGYIKSKQTILMDGKTIEQLGKPNYLTDAVNKEYVDEKLKNIPFTKVNGHFIASNNLDMGVKKITNLALPSNEQDATNKEYVDGKIIKLGEEDRERKAETDRIRVLFSEKEEEIKKYVDEETAKVLTRDTLIRIYSTSILLIRAEAKGPIIGQNEILNSNNRRPSPNTPGGYIALDANGEIIKPTVIYFGKYDGGNNNIYPRLIIPAQFKINKYGLFFEGANSESFDMEIKGEYDVNNLIKTYKLTSPKIQNNKLYCKDISKSHSFTYENCNSLYLYFNSSHPNVTRFFITFVCVLQIPEFNISWLEKDGAR